jgi:hypothetical protein
MVKSMKPGSVIVDMAARAGRQLPAHRSRPDGGEARRDAGRRDQPARPGGGRRAALYARNVLDFLKLIVDQGRRAEGRPMKTTSWRLPDDPDGGEVTEEVNHGHRLPHHHQPDHLRAGHLRGLPRGVDRHARAAHAADGGDQRHLGHRHRRRHAGGRAHRDRPGQDHGRAGRGAGGGQRVRRLPGHAAHAGDVQEEREERPAAARHKQ